MRKLVILLLCVVFMSSCSWFGSKSSSNSNSLDAEIGFLDDEDTSLSLEKDIKNLSNKPSSEDQELEDLDELDNEENDSDALADELDSDEDELDKDEDEEVVVADNNSADPLADELDEDELDEDEVAGDNLAEEDNDPSVAGSETDNKDELLGAGSESDKKEQESYSDEFVDTNETDKGDETATAEVGDDASLDSTSSSSVDDSFSDPALVKTYISVKKIKSAPYTKNNILANAVYIARQGDTLTDISNKIYSANRKKQLLQVNPHLGKYSELPVGTKIYYNSPSRAEDSVNLLTYYEEQNLEPQIYTTVEGDNLRKLGKQLLGHSRSWQELWATNSSVESKSALPAGVNIRYWGTASASIALQQAEAKKQAEKQAEIEAKEAAVNLAAVEKQRIEEEKLKLENEKLETNVQENANANANTNANANANANANGSVVTKEASTKPEALANKLAENNLAETNKPNEASAAADPKGTSEEAVGEQAPKIPIVAAEQKKQEVAVVVPAVASDQGLLDQALKLLDNDMVLYSLMGLFLLIIVFLFIRRKKTDAAGGGGRDQLEELDENTGMFLGSLDKSASDEDHGQGQGQGDTTQMDSTQMDATQMDSTQMDATQMDSTQMDSTQMDSEEEGHTSLLLGEEEK